MRDFIVLFLFLVLSLLSDVLRANKLPLSVQVLGLLGGTFIPDEEEYTSSRSLHFGVDSILFDLIWGAWGTIHAHEEELYRCCIVKGVDYSRHY